MSIEKLTDESPMPWGMHRGKEMQKVPAEYLLYLYETRKLDKQVGEYVARNKETLEIERKQNKRYK